MQKKKSTDRKNVHAGAGAGAVIRIFSYAEPEPKEIFTAPQHYFLDIRSRSKIQKSSPNTGHIIDKGLHNGRVGAVCVLPVAEVGPVVSVRQVEDFQQRFHHLQ